MSDNIVIDQENPYDKGIATEKRYCFNKCTKRQCILWSICCGVCVAIIIIVVLVLLFAVAPSMAQSAMTASVIEIETMQITGSTKDSMNTTMKFNAWNTYTMGATMKSATFKVTFGEDVIGTMDMPELKLNAHSKNTFTERLVLKVGDMSAFNKYASALMTSDKIEMGMSGKVKISSLGLDFTVNMDKKMALTGFANFNSISTDMDNSDETHHLSSASGDGVDVRRPVLKSIDFEESKPTDVSESIIAIGVSILPNPSQLTIADGGIMEADVYAAGKKVGTAKSTSNINVGVNGGEVTMRMTITKSKDNEAALRIMFGNYISGVSTKMVIQGTGSSLQLWSGAMKAMKVAVVVPGLVDDRDKMFQGIQVPLNMTAASSVAQNASYCIQNFGKTACADGILGKTMPTNAVLHNSLGMDVSVSNYAFNAYLASLLPDICHIDSSYCSNTGFNYTGMLFAKASPYEGVGGYWPHYPQPFTKNKQYEATVKQKEISLGKKSTLPMGMALSSALKPISAEAFAFLGDLIMPLTLQMRNYPGKGMAPWFYGQDAVPILINVNGTGTMKTNSGFMLEEVSIFQNGIRSWVNFMYPSTIDDEFKPYMYGAPVMQSFPNAVDAMTPIDCTTKCTTTGAACEPSKSDGNFVMTCASTR